MSFVFDKSKYKHLIANDIPVAPSKISDGSDIPSLLGNIPEKYSKPFIHPEDGFVKKYCEDYDRPNEPIKIKKYSDDGPKGLIKRKKYFKKIIKGGK